MQRIQSGRHLSPAGHLASDHKSDKSTMIYTHVLNRTVRVLKKLFRGKVLAALKAAEQKGELSAVSDTQTEVSQHVLHNQS